MADWVLVSHISVDTRKQRRLILNRLQDGFRLFCTDASEDFALFVRGATSAKQTGDVP